MRHPHGFPGRYCGRAIGDEKELIRLFDGDDPGRDAIRKIGRDLLAAGFRVVAPVVPKDFKPHRVDERLLRMLVSGQGRSAATSPFLSLDGGMFNVRLALESGSQSEPFRCPLCAKGDIGGSPR